MRKIITIGNFDGIHLGHRKLLQIMLDESHSRALQSVVITYRNHPAYTLYHPSHPLLIMPIETKIKQLRCMGIDQIEVLDFTPEFASRSAVDFLRYYLIPVFHPSVIVVGFDSHFGKAREGDYQFLRQYADEYGYELIYVEPVLHEGSPVSSSMIRNLLHRAKITEANSLLASPFTLRGKVVSGKGWGRDLGFPTANIEPEDPLQLVPGKGIYLSKVHLPEGTFYGLTNIGTSPTLKMDGVVQIETYIIDFSGDIYGLTIEVGLISYLRNELIFQSKEELIEAMRNDLAQAKRIIGNLS
ncbi:MAG TPA: bifunctional riboflavin kinase/FAD synthetase [Candidatus Cloacimonadota bacterium]|nr:bifunctional riboflavin kinase/FAD synthetase [Candidatus Cloacimonadota bacterium]HPS39425.1 bifunctional riboflavin kinase/FAD synthetase [Candidatus Cloacimonadota bacterium]